MTLSTTENKPLKLPPLRPGITFRFNEYNAEGKPEWLIQDTARNKFFIIGWIEYELLERWSIGDADELVSAVNQGTTLAVDKNDVENFLRFLTSNYLIQQSGYQIYKTAKEQKIFKNDNAFSWLISYYLFFRVPLLHPDKFLDRTRKIGDFLFSKTLGIIMSVLLIIGLYQLSIHWEKFTHTFATLFTWQGLFFYFIAYSICKLCHELGHAYMCKRFGVPVPSLGVAFLVFWPVLYTDTTLSWSLNSKKRMQIALAGMWVETYVTIIALLIWCSTNDTTIKSIAYMTVAINWVASLLINVSPFMRFDGYYVLADFLKMPNLQPRAFALTRWQIRRWLFHWADPPPEVFTKKMHYFLVAYSLFTWIYRLGVYFGIALMVYHFFIKAVGIVLFVVELFYFILGPIYSEIQTWVHFKDKFSLNLRTKITLAATCMLLLIFVVPMSESIKLPGTMSYAHQFLIVPTDSILISTLPAKGTPFKADQTIVKLRSTELDDLLKESILNYTKKMEEYRRSTINPEYSVNRGILLSDISKQSVEYKKLLSLHNRLMLSVPFDGIVMEMDYDLHPGAILMKDQWIGDVINPNQLLGEGYVSQMEINSLKTGLTGYFYPHDLSEPKISVKITSIEVTNQNALTCPYSSEVKIDKEESLVVETPCFNSTEVGGDIPAVVSDKNEHIPVNSVYRVLLKAKQPVPIEQIERGTFVIETKPTSYASRFFYEFKTLWVKQSGF